MGLAAVILVHLLALRLSLVLLPGSGGDWCRLTACLRSIVRTTWLRWRVWFWLLSCCSLFSLVCCLSSSSLVCGVASCELIGSAWQGCGCVCGCVCVLSLFFRLPPSAVQLASESRSGPRERTKRGVSGSLGIPEDSSEALGRETAPDDHDNHWTTCSEILRPETVTLVFTGNSNLKRPRALEHGIKNKGGGEGNFNLKSLQLHRSRSIYAYLLSSWLLFMFRRLCKLFLFIGTRGSGDFDQKPGLEHVTVRIHSH